jgi:hypothetical protein
MDVQWKLETGRGEHILHLDWRAIQNALVEMNGATINEVVLELVGKGSLFVEGGDEGRYLVVYFPASHPDTPSLTLADLSLTGPDVKLTVQTQSEYAARHAVKLPLVLKVVEHFFQTGEVPKDVRWELDSSGIEAKL